MGSNVGLANVNDNNDSEDELRIDIATMIVKLGLDGFKHVVGWNEETKEDETVATALVKKGYAFETILIATAGDTRDTTKTKVIKVDVAMWIN